MAKRNPKTQELPAGTEPQSTPASQSNEPAAVPQFEPAAALEPAPPQSTPSAQGDGITFSVRMEPNQAEIAFRDQPPKPVLDFVKEKGFRWSRQEKRWALPIRPDQPAEDLALAQRTYEDVLALSERERQAGPTPTLATTTDVRPVAGGPIPRLIDRNAATGVELRDRAEPYESQIVFPEQPAQAVLDLIKQQGFHWSRENKLWRRPIEYNTRFQDREVAKRTYDEVNRMLLADKGISPETGHGL